MVKYKFFFKSTKTDSPTSHSRATSLPPICTGLMYMKTSFGIHGNGVFGSFEQTDIIQNNESTFYYNRFSNPTNISIKVLSSFRISILLAGNTWSTR